MKIQSSGIARTRAKLTNFGVSCKQVIAVALVNSSSVSATLHNVRHRPCRESGGMPWEVS